MNMSTCCWCSRSVKSKQPGWMCCASVGEICFAPSSRCSQPRHRGHSQVSFWWCCAAAKWSPFTSTDKQQIPSLGSEKVVVVFAWSRACGITALSGEQGLQSETGGAGWSGCWRCSQTLIQRAPKRRCWSWGIDSALHSGGRSFVHFSAVISTFTFQWDLLSLSLSEVWCGNCLLKLDWGVSPLQWEHVQIFTLS